MDSHASCVRRATELRERIAALEAGRDALIDALQRNGLGWVAETVLEAARKETP